MNESVEDSVELPRQVYCELKTVQQMGLHDMRTEEVFTRLDAYDFDAARDWILEHPEEYIRALENGMRDGD